MKTRNFIIILLLVFQCCYSSNNLYEAFIGKKLSNEYNCKSSLFLYPYGRFDKYGCEMELYSFGVFWVERDTLFLETFCTDYPIDESRCTYFRKDAYIIEKDSLLWARYWKDDGVRGSNYREEEIKHRICWGHE